MQGQTSKAAEVLGKPQGELITIMSGQQKQRESLLASDTVR